MKIRYAAPEDYEEVEKILPRHSRCMRTYAQMYTALDL